MEKRNRMRLGMALLILAITLAIVGLPDRSAYAGCGISPACSGWNVCPRCENCEAREQACLDGFIRPECGGDPSCCAAAVSACYNCCIWY
jgi:hypothetical protein